MYRFYWVEGCCAKQMLVEWFGSGEGAAHGSGERVVLNFFFDLINV